MPLVHGTDAQAFLLAREGQPMLDSGRWGHFLSDWRQSQERGLIGTMNQRGALLGVAAWWMLPDLQHRRVLWAEIIAVHELGLRPLVRDALTRRLDAMAAESHAALRLLCAGCHGERRRREVAANDPGAP